jgi:hypothetical protein
MIKTPRQSIADLAEQIKNNLIEDSLEFSKKGGHSKRSHHEKRLTTITTDRDNHSQRFTVVDDVSLSFVVTDRERERSRNRKARPPQIAVCPVSAGAASQKSTAKMFCQNRSQGFNLQRQQLQLQIQLQQKQHEHSNNQRW